nr:hypothetical protein CFP56_10238 [Quercus suber]
MNDSSDVILSKRKSDVSGRQTYKKQRRKSEKRKTLVLYGMDKEVETAMTIMEEGNGKSQKSSRTSGTLRTHGDPAGQTAPTCFTAATMRHRAGTSRRIAVDTRSLALPERPHFGRTRLAPDRWVSEEAGRVHGCQQEMYGPGAGDMSCIRWNDDDDDDMAAAAGKDSETAKSERQEKKRKIMRYTNHSMMRRRASSSRHHFPGLLHHSHTALD